jgi:AbrB family looped-hinge helix DNA binding protein
MEAVTISRDYRVVIPKAIREQLKLVPGQTMQVIAYGDRIELLPVKPASELRGFLAGTDISFERDEEDRL